MSKPNLTLGLIRERHKKNPRDRKLHKKIEKGKFSVKILLGFLRKA